MEDISRELEKEIAQSKPSPYKKNRKKSFLIVDDFGEIKSAGHLKVFVYAFLVIGTLSFFAAGGFYILFSQKALENKQLKLELTDLKKKVNSLVADNEILMARLVISGIKPGISDPVTASGVPSVNTAKEKKAGIKGKAKLEKISSTLALDTKAKKDAKIKADKIKAAKIKAAKIEAAKVKAAKVKAAKIKDAKVDEKTSVSENIGVGKTQISPQKESKGQSSVQKIVAIEKFSVTREGVDGDLLVRFDIRNMSEKPGGISGRIFTILKPDNKPQAKWLVVPKARLKNGIPSQYKKGQYFSIAHFKPVKFRIENQEGPEFYKKAAIYIFNEKGELMFENLIDITEEESGL